MTPVFIGMPKCGTTFMLRYKIAVHNGFESFGHTPLRDIKHQPEYYYFGFVRNPWAWYVSRYNYFYHSDNIEKGVSRKADAGLGGNAFRERFPEFNDHMVWGFSQPGFSFTARYTQMFYDGTRWANYIGRLETVDRDVEKVFIHCGKQYNITFASYRNTYFNNDKMANRKHHSHYTDFYGPELREKVLQIDREVIRRYGYRYGEDH